MRQMNWSVLGRVAAAAIAAAASLGAARAQGKGGEPSAAAGATAAAGVVFHDADIDRAVQMLESGEPDGAISFLKKVIDDPNAAKNAERDAELKAALGMLYARAGKIDQAAGALRPLTALGENAEIVPRAQVLLAAATGAYKDGTKGARQLGPRDGWLTAVRGVRRDLDIKLSEQDGKFAELVKGSQWGALPGALAKLGPLVEQIDAIEVDRAATDQILTRHRAAVSGHSERIGAMIRDHKDAMARMEREREHSRGPNNRASRTDLKQRIEEERKTIATLEDVQKLMDPTKSGAGQGEGRRKRRGR